MRKNCIIGVGIAMPGFVNIEKGINYSFLFTDNKSISKIIADKVGLPVYIDNDSSLIALAELRFGAVNQKKNVMVLNIGWGVGLGLILNGELFRGHDGFAGEFSHIPLFNNNKLCACGKNGCLETETSLVVLIEKAKEGIYQIVWGLVKKVVIADTCANYANEIFNHSNSMNSLSLILGAVYFAFKK